MLSIYVFLLLHTFFGVIRAYQGDSVLMLTRKNFTNAVAENEFLLVNFYAPWCGHCKLLSSEYMKVAGYLIENNLPVKLAQVDATIDDELAYEQQVRSYPTIKFFRNGEAILYDGGRLAEDILNWLKKEIQPSTRELKNIDDMEKFMDQNEIGAIGFFKNQETVEATIYLTISKQLKNFTFGVTSNEESFTAYNAKESDIMLFKPYDEKKIFYEGPYNLESLKKFIQLESLPLIMEFEHKTASKILRGPTKSFLLFFISEKKQLENYINWLNKLAKQYRHTVLFVTVTYDEYDKKRAFEYFCIKRDETPTIRLITLNEQNDLIKYKPNSDEISRRILEEFIQQYAEDNLKPHYLSQTLPDDWNAQPLITLVASNFKEIVYDSNKIVLVEFYAPWCGHCKQLELIFKRLAEKYQDNNKIIIAKINGVANEIENFKVTTFPTIKLFRTLYADVIDYERARTYDDLVQFIEEQLNTKDEL